MKHELTGLVLVLGLAAITFLTNLGGARLWDRDEPRNAGCAAEMLQRGDWVVPVFNGELRAHKPVLLYWLMMASYEVFGIHEFSARIVSALFGMGTVWLTYAIARRLYDRSVAVWSGCVLATCTMFCMVSRAATPDATLVFFATAALAVFVYGAFDHRGQLKGSDHLEGRLGRWPFPVSWWLAAGMYGLMGLAVLAKGPVGLVLPTAVLGMFCLLCRLPVSPDSATAGGWSQTAIRLARAFAPLHFLRTCWAMRPVTAVAVAGLIAGPWYIWVGVRTGGDWLVGFLGEHNLGRALTPMEGHDGPVYYYVVAILIGLFPWSVISLPMWLHHHRTAREDIGRRAAVLFLACWVGVYVGLFTLARTKLPSYVVPAYPALAILAGSLMDALVRSSARVAAAWMTLGFAILASVGAVATAALSWAGQHWLEGDTLVAVVGIVPMLAGAAGVVAWWRNHRHRAGGLLVGAAALQAVLMFGWLSERVSDNRQDLALIAQLRQQGNAQPLATFQRLEPSWVFYAQRTIPEFSEGNVSELTRYLQRHPAARIITTEAGAMRLRELFPGTWNEISEADYFLREERLVVVAPEQLPLQRMASWTGRPARHERSQPQP